MPFGAAQKTGYRNHGRTDGCTSQVSPFNPLRGLGRRRALDAPHLFQCHPRALPTALNIAACGRHRRQDARQRAQQLAPRHQQPMPFVAHRVHWRRRDRAQSLRASRLRDHRSWSSSASSCAKRRKGFGSSPDAISDLSPPGSRDFVKKGGCRTVTTLQGDKSATLTSRAHRGCSPPPARCSRRQSTGKAQPSLYSCR